MYLSKLEIFGFKSFAHKVNFQFKDGVTAVIGPNGCGKSNIVDAIRWVLGEQRPSLLRLDRMENVIFNGTASRKPLSMAEVSMYIENTKNILPSIYSEVKITRRLYRSGDSEYLLNNRQVRLKDVIDLFTDTGMGSDAYSVIELKMVEQILSENAEERRRLFEEAAGIKKYKFRRKSALRKLETTEQELVRLNDVISEVQKTVNSLSRQVGKARRYHEFKNELKQKELFIYQLKVQGYEQELVPLREEYSQIRETRERLGREVNQGEAELEKYQLQAVDLEGRFREVSGRLNTADEKIRGIQQQVQLNDQKIESLKENIEKARRDIEAQNARSADLEQQLEANGKEKAETESLAEKKQLEYTEKANAQVEAERRLEKVRKNFQQFRAENVNTLSEISRQREEYQRITIQKNNIVQQAERLAGLKKSLSEDLESKQKQLDELEQELEASREDAGLYEKERELLLKQVTELQERLELLETEKNQLIGKIEKLKSRQEFLRNLIDNYEGFSESVQYVMSNKKNFSGLVDTLANMVDTTDEYRPALESYLEEIANYLVVEEVDTAQNILSEIRNQKKGRLTLVPLSLLNTSRNGKPDLSQLNGETIPLKNVVQFDSRFEQLFNFLFDRVILVEDVNSALEWRKKYPSMNFLTRNGELLGDWGNITGGNSRQSLNLTGRKHQFEKVASDLRLSQKRQEEIEAELISIRENTAEKKGKVEEFDRLLKEQQKSLNQLEQKFNQHQYEIQRSAERLTETEQELDSLQQQIGELESREKALLPDVQEADRKQQAFQEEDLRLNSEMEAADQEYRRLSREVQQLQIEYLNKKNYIGELEQKAEYIRQTISEIEKGLVASSREIENYQAQIAQIENESAGHRSQLDALYEGRDEVEKEKLEVENSYQSLKSVIVSREEDIKKLHRRWNQAL
ncbi:MAG: chromosome segregation protein SMC, partial [Calditrichia bacterium]